MYTKDLVSVKKQYLAQEMTGDGTSYADKPVRERLPSKSFTPFPSQ
jgi:hypothetical protein